MQSASRSSGSDVKVQPPLVLKDSFVVRIAGLPVQSLTRLRFVQTLAQLDHFRRMEQDTIVQEKALAERLYPLVATFAGVEHKQVRNRLIELRRAFFQGRVPKTQLMSGELLVALPHEIAAAVRHCYQLRNELQQACMTMQACFERELLEKRQELFIIAQQDSLLRGMILASQSLYCELLQHDTTQIRDAESKLERGLMSYMMRATAKTSPYSTFTSLAPGSWLPDETQTSCVAHVQTDTDNHWLRKSNVEGNLLLIQQIAHIVMEWPEVRPTLNLSVNSTLVEMEQTLFFLVHQQQGNETLVHLGNTAIIKHILSLIRRRQPATYGQVLQQLVSGIDQSERALAIGRFLDQLIEKGLLALDFAIPEQSLDYLGQLITRLAPIAHERVQTLVQHLTSLHSALRDYEQLSSTAACYAQAQHIQHVLQSITTMLGLEDSWLPAKNLFYENCFLSEVQLACSAADWREAEKNLGYLQRLTGLFDPFLPGRLTLVAFFVERYGEEAEVDLLSFYEAFYKESRVAGQRQQPTGAALVMQLFTMPFFTPVTSNPALQQVVYWRKRIVQWLSSQPCEEDGSRRLPPEELVRMLDECATVWQVPQSLAYYCQIYPDKQHFQLVVNALQSGFGRTRGRLQYIQRNTPQRNTLPPTQTEQVTDNIDPLVVSIQGVFGSNINVRVEATPYEIVYPGQVSMRPQEEQLPLHDLLVGYDAKTQRLSLRSRSLQRTLLPVHLGMMSDYWLPSLYRFLSWAFADAPADPLWGLRLIGMPDIEKGFSEGIRAVPRVFLGNICLYRAHWLVPANAVPRRKKGETDFAYFWRLHCWRQENALPQQCFIRANAFDFTQRTNFQIDSTGGSSNRVMRKPLYIDFASYFSVLTFEHIAEQCEFGFLLEEALPELETQVVHVGQDAYVSEYVFEVEQKR